jgi:ribosomal protein S8
MINYNIGDLVARINNSYRAGKGELSIPFSKDNYQVLTQLTKLGVVVSCSTNVEETNASSATPRQTIKVVLKKNLNSLNYAPFCGAKGHQRFPSGRHASGEILNSKDSLGSLFFSENLESGNKTISCNIAKKNILTLVSKPGKRIYISYKDLCNFNNGFKLYLLRTSKGIVSSQTALKNKIGGELLIKLSFV